MCHSCRKSEGTMNIPAYDKNECSDKPSMHGEPRVLEGQQLQSWQMFTAAGTPFAAAGFKLIVTLNHIQPSFAKLA
jgi:hypothetical protein